MIINISRFSGSVQQKVDALDVGLLEACFSRDLIFIKGFVFNKERLLRWQPRRQRSREHRAEHGRSRRADGCLCVLLGPRIFNVGLNALIIFGMTLIYVILVHDFQKRT